MSLKSKVEEATRDIDFAINNFQIRLETSLGNVVLDLLPDVAPNHCRNMIGLTRIGFYDGLTFHRVIKGFMIQGGCPTGNGTGNPGYQISAEFNETPHVAGVLSMARSSNPNSAGSQFFICLGAHEHLDRNYTAFGRTADEASLDVVRQIGGVETGANDKPVREVKIERAVVTVV
ncbi:MAG TPA: peptidylprolyl isomerase [Pirellulaceae bacterium]|nr:peptidylprolyl isomerase [Pirellulaceae bacterium]